MHIHGYACHRYACISIDVHDVSRCIRITHYLQGGGDPLRLLLQFGLPPKLFNPEADGDFITNALRDAGLSETSFELFEQRVRRLLRVVCCMSSSGEGLRSVCKTMPALVNNATFVWFQPWPEEALRSVAAVTLADLEDVAGPTVLESLGGGGGAGGGTTVKDACIAYLTGVLLSVRSLPADAAPCCGGARSSV